MTSSSPSFSTIISIFEQQSYSYESLGLTDHAPLLHALEGLNQRSGIQFIQLGRKELRATQYVGVIQVDKCLIQILPKIDFDPKANINAPQGSSSYEYSVNSAARNFIFLLNYALGLKFNNQTLTTLSTSRGNWTELLISLFARELQMQLERGFHQDYIRKEDLLPYIRGRWNIARQFICQPNIIQGLDVSYDDYLPDILLNRVFRLVIDRLQRVSHQPSNRQILADLELWLQPVTLVRELSNLDLDQVKFDRLNDRFYSAFQLARLFLENQTVQLLAGGQRALAFVFDMDKLFEKFVAKLLQEHANQILPGDWLGQPLELQGGSKINYLVQPPYPNEQPMFQLKPDVLLGFPGMPILIIDTKNKALPLRRYYRSIAESDAYQMIAYATHFHCPNILLLYPRSQGAEDTLPTILSVEQTHVRLFIATVNLHQPLDRLDPLIRDFRDLFSYLYLHNVSHSEVTWSA